MKQKNKIIDLSQEIKQNMPIYPGDPKIKLTTIHHKEYTISEIRMGSHTGTHIDLPGHVYRKGKSAKKAIPIANYIGPAVIVNVRGQKEIGTKELEKNKKIIQHCKRVILYTGWNEQKRKNNGCQNPVLKNETVEWLVKKKTKLIAIDAPGIDRPPHTAHKRLLGNKCGIVENIISLHKIKDTQVNLIVAPLKMNCKDGAPVRAFAVIQK